MLTEVLIKKTRPGVVLSNTQAVKGKYQHVQSELKIKSMVLNNRFTVPLVNNKQQFT